MNIEEFTNFILIEMLKTLFIAATVFTIINGVPDWFQSVVTFIVIFVLLVAGSTKIMIEVSRYYERQDKN